MPRVKPLTEAQHMEQMYQRRLKWMADGLATYKNRQRMTNAEVASALSIGVNTVAKLLNAEEVKLSTKDMFRIMDACGLTVEKKREQKEMLGTEKRKGSEGMTLEGLVRQIVIEVLVEYGR